MKIFVHDYKFMFSSAIYVLVEIQNEFDKQKTAHNVGHSVYFTLYVFHSFFICVGHPANSEFCHLPYLHLVFSFCSPCLFLNFVFSTCFFLLMCVGYPDPVYS